MIKKIDTFKIEYKSNVFVFIWYCNNFIKMKSKWFLKINLNQVNIKGLNRENKDKIEKKKGNDFSTPSFILVR
jgi:hypothetical protein